MGKLFPIIIIIVAVVGFSSSAYFFSESNISIDNPNFDIAGIQFTLYDFPNHPIIHE